MRLLTPTTARWYWVPTMGVTAAGLAMALWYAPVDGQMGVVQKLIYLHLPAAIASFLTAAGVAIGSFSYLWTRDDRWDESARMAAYMTVVFSTIVLGTGMVWGHFFWGYWWTWSPRLTFTLILFALYLGYLLVRAAIAQSSRRAVVCAIYGLLAFLDVPLLYLSVRLLPDVHPTSIPMTGPMRLTVAICLLASGLIACGVTVRPWWRPGTTPAGPNGAGSSRYDGGRPTARSPG